MPLLTPYDLRLALSYVRRGIDYHLTDDPAPLLVTLLALVLLVVVAWAMSSVTVALVALVLGIAHVVRLGLQGAALADKDDDDPDIYGV